MSAMSGLDAFFADGMSVYKPETSHLRTKEDFASAMPFLETPFDEQGQPLRPKPEKAIRCLSIQWFLWQASLSRFNDERAPRSMKAIKIRIGNWCATAGRKDLAEIYQKEADEEYQNFTFPHIAQASASPPQQCVP
ncbi:MAG TPA: hypothetical protein PLO43_02625, partial [Chlamydiales bacterium]|nr:hypothetical protein [Chlamydiales bacterium]